MQTVSRADLIRGRWGRRQTPQIRPPGALDEVQFETACSRCGDCARACPEALIVAGAGGFPVIDYARGGCTFCGECQRACPRALLRADAPARLPWLATPGESCLGLGRIECRVCGEVCDARAITFVLALGQAARPACDASLCDGCGSCVGACPVGAITMQPVAIEEKA